MKFVLLCFIHAALAARGGGKGGGSSGGKAGDGGATGGIASTAGLQGAVNEGMGKGLVDGRYMNEQLRMDCLKFIGGLSVFYLTVIGITYCTCAAEE